MDLYNTQQKPKEDATKLSSIKGIQRKGQQYNRRKKNSTVNNCEVN